MLRQGPAATVGAERRRAPRYPVTTGLFASIDGQTVRLRNISRHGVAIHGNGLAPGGSHLLELNLNRHHVSLAVEILDCPCRNLLHARFLEPSTHARQLIDAYIHELSSATGGGPDLR